MPRVGTHPEQRKLTGFRYQGRCGQCDGRWQGPGEQEQGFDAPPRQHEVRTSGPK